MIGRVDYYPSPEHAEAARAITGYWAAQGGIDAVLLVNSCARGVATRDSCLDLTVLVPENAAPVQMDEWQVGWERYSAASPEIRRLAGVGKFSAVHLDLHTGVFEPTEQDEAAGPDGFELAIGNTVAYSVPLWQADDRLGRLRERWLPYYPEPLQQQRLARVRFFCRNNLAHIPLYVERGLYFQAFDRLYNAHQEFLQALFIHRRIYPIAYNKWIHEQLVERLHLPDLYRELTRLFEIDRLESAILIEKATQLEQLLVSHTA